jgi:transposase
MQADGYRVYRMFAAEQPGIIRVRCLAHVRRKFHEAAKASKKAGAAHEGMKYISTIYRIEKEFRSHELEADDFVRRRRELVELELERFHAWLQKKQSIVVPSTLLGKAITCALREWEALIRYLDLEYITPDNNEALCSGFHNPQDSRKSFVEGVNSGFAA